MVYFIGMPLYTSSINMGCVCTTWWFCFWGLIFPISINPITHSYETPHFYGPNRMWKFPTSTIVSFRGCLIWTGEGFSPWVYHVASAPMIVDLVGGLHHFSYGIQHQYIKLTTHWWLYELYIWLVVTGTCFMTFHILGRIIPTDELIFFRGVGIPPTSDTPKFAKSALKCLR